MMKITTLKIKILLYVFVVCSALRANSESVCQIAIIAKDRYAAMLGIDGKLCISGKISKAECDARIARQKAVAELSTKEGFSMIAKGEYKASGTCASEEFPITCPTKSDFPIMTNNAKLCPQ